MFGETENVHEPINTAVDQPMYRIEGFEFPDQQDIPNNFFLQNDPWVELTILIFYIGVNNSRVSKYKLKPKIDQQKIPEFWQWWRSHLGYTGYEHNYKISACAYALSQAFEMVDIES